MKNKKNANSTTEVNNQLNKLDKKLQECPFENISVDVLKHEVIEASLSHIKELFSEFNLFPKIIKDRIKYNISQERSANAIINNFIHTFKWINDDTPIRNSERPYENNKMFIKIDLFITPLRIRRSFDEEVEKITYDTLVREISKNLIIFGGPGYGKTTLLKNICKFLLTSPGLKFKFSSIFVIRFRDLEYPKGEQAKKFGLFEILANLFGINIIIPEFDPDNIVLASYESHYEKLNKTYYSVIKNSILTILKENKLLIVLDGYDEIPEINIKTNVFNDLLILLNPHINSRFIMSSRNGEIEIQTTIETLDLYEICPLSKEQVSMFIFNWLRDKDQSNKLEARITDSPFNDAAKRPLILSLLCILYKRTGNIPQRPREIYDRMITLLIEAWDADRDIRRKSAYASFYTETKKDFLTQVAFILTHDLDKLVFTTKDLESCYRKLNKSFSLPENQARKVVNEIESHNGIIEQVGINSFQFSHTSLQEFLSAKYILSWGGDIPTNTIIKMPNEVAIAIALNPNPNLIFPYFCIKLSNNQNPINESIWTILINRLAIEKPSFKTDPHAILFIFQLIDNSGNSVGFPNSKNLAESIILLLKETNIKIGYNEVLSYYSKSSRFIDKKTVYSFKDLKTPKTGRLFSFKTKFVIPNYLVQLLE